MYAGRNNSMVKYIIKRLLQLFPIVLGITFLSFTLMHSVSGDAIDILYENAGGEVTEEVKEERRSELGLDQPFLVQYADWLFQFVQGDMGKSYISGKDVFQTFWMKLPSTIYLAITAILLTVCFSIPFGILSALNQNKWLDYLIRFLSFIGNSLPGFFVSLIFILIFSVKLGWFSAMGNEGVKSIILPALTLSLAMTSKYTRQIRALVLEELSKDYVSGAKAKGVKEWVILYRSVLKSVMFTTITLFALSIGSLLGGTAIVEAIFMWDGVGKLALDSIMMRDYPMIQAYVVWMAIIYILVNLITDILYHTLDPRVRLGMEERQ
jgi:peptide/nickel transport system permease protein